jgi:hypothetical protein
MPAAPPRVEKVTAAAWRPGRNALLAAGGALLAVVLGVVAFRGIGGGDNGQPSPVTSASEEPALRLTSMIADGAEALASGVSYEVFDAAQSAEGERTRVASSPAYNGPPRFPLAPGRYYVTAAYGSATASTELEIPARTLVQQTLLFHAGVLRPVAHLSASSAALDGDVLYEVFDAAVDAEGNRRKVTSSPAYQGPPRFTLPAGRYYVTAQHASASTAAEVELAEGENKALPLDLRAGVLRLSAVLSDGSMPLENGVLYDVDESTKDAEGASKRVVSSPAYQGPPRLPVPAGRYTVTATHGNAVAKAEVDLSPAEIERVVINLHAGVLSVTSSANGQAQVNGVNYDVYEAAKDAEGARKRITGSPAYEGPPRWPMPRGRYFVTASGNPGAAGAEIDVPEGVVTTIDLKLARGAQNPR